MAPADSDGPARLAAVPPERRSSVLIRSLAELFNVVPEHLAEDMDRFEALFRPLYAEADLADRAHVAHVLTRRRDLPTTVARDILMDDPAIAGPFAAAAPSLDEALLIEAVGRGETELNMAIATRDGLPDAVVLALLAVADDDVVAQLSDNPTAVLPESLLAEFESEVDAAARSTATAVAEFERFAALDDGERFRFIAAFTAETMLRHVDASAHGHDVRRPPAGLFAKATSGDRAGVIADLAAALEMDPAVARRIVDDAGGEPLAVALAAIGADSTLATGLMLWLLPENSRSYWRLGLLRGVHEDIGWRAASALVETWSGRAPASPRQDQRPATGSQRPPKTATRRIADAANARRSGTRH